MELPCPRCGSADTLGTFCKKCLTKLYPLVKSIKDVKIQVCADCERVHTGGRWTASMTPALENSLNISERASIDEAQFILPEMQLKAGVQKTSAAKVKLIGKDEEADSSYTEEYEIPVMYSVTLCPTCKKRGTTYYEGILQVRNETAASQQFMHRYLSKHGKKGVHLTDKKPANNGTDYFLSSHRAVGHLARQLHKEFGGELKVAAQHFSEDKQQSKILYRTNALITLPEYKKGDVVKRDDEYFHILGVRSKITAEKLPSGSEESFIYRRGEAMVLSKQPAKVINTHPLQVIHPVTFQAIEPLRSKYAPSDIETDQEVIVAIDGEKAFLPMQL